MKKFYIMFLVGLALVGCKSSPKNSSLFENSVCELPCWENITPGVTTKDEAIVILSKIDAVDRPVLVLNNTARGFDVELRFSLSNEKDSLQGAVYILDDQVSLINFGTKLDITLQRAIELFGVPQSILAFRSNLYWVTLINSKTGVAFGYSSAGHPDWVYSEIRPEVEISEVVFFDPKQYPQILDSGFLSNYLLSSDEIKSKLRFWNGYGGLNQYEK